MPSFVWLRVGALSRFAEREEIALLRAEGMGVREIARWMGRSPSTISRELRRNAATRGGRLDYRASVAQWHAEQRAKRPKPAKLAVNDRLRDYVQERLAGACAPARASLAGQGRVEGAAERSPQGPPMEPGGAERLRVGWCGTFPGCVDAHSHEAIYQSLRCRAAARCAATVGLPAHRPGAAGPRARAAGAARACQRRGHDRQRPPRPNRAVPGPGGRSDPRIERRRSTPGRAHTRLRWASPAAAASADVLKVKNGPR